MINFSEPEHRLGEELEVGDYALVDAMSWWVASELVRRHPKDLTVVEMHPAGGLYDCLSVTVRPDSPLARNWQGRFVHMNRDRGAHITINMDTGDRFNWVEVLIARDRRSYVVSQIEREFGLKSPSTTPSTASSSIGPWLIASFLRRSLFDRKGWYSLNGYLDTAGHGGGVRTEFFESINGMENQHRVGGEQDFLGESAYRYWFLGRTGPSQVAGDSGGKLDPPKFAIDVRNGIGWFGGPTGVDLMKVYDSVGRSMDALVSKVCPPAN